ncbi:MAG: HlyD family type I secretion periplasmic adaptor subunit [Sphingomonas sp.]|nr:HlyD family type I secretion periplasmic adaptor subunit [Sphingomonas sp.]
MAAPPIPEMAKPRVRRASAWLLWGIVGFFLLFLVWAWLTRLDRTVRAEGRVIPTSQLQVISNPEGGIVEAIRVRVSDTVARGDPLLMLDRTQMGAELGSGQAQVGALDLKIARLEAEVAGRVPRYPAIASAALGSQIAVEQALHGARMADLESLRAAADARLTQAEREAAAARSMLAARRTMATARATEADLVAPLVDKGLEPRLSLVQARASADAARSEAMAAQSALARAEAQIAEARAQRAVAVAQWRAQAANELATVQAERAAKGEALPALEERAARTIVRAPVAGTINRVLVTTTGGVVQPGQPLVEIVPAGESLLIDARVLPEDIGTVALGQRARVSLTAYNRATYGQLEGRVVAISPDATVDERTGRSHYTIRVKTSLGHLIGPDGKRHAIGAGMVAEVDLLGEPRTILEYLLSPVLEVGRTAFRE